MLDGWEIRTEFCKKPFYFLYTVSLLPLGAQTFSLAIRVPAGVVGMLIWNTVLKCTVWSKQWEVNIILNSSVLYGGIQVPFPRDLPRLCQFSQCFCEQYWTIGSSERKWIPMEKMVGTSRYGHASCPSHVNGRREPWSIFPCSPSSWQVSPGSYSASRGRSLKLTCQHYIEKI